MEEKKTWGEEDFWIEVLENKQYLPEEIIKEATFRKLVRTENFQGKKVLDYGCGTGSIGKIVKDMGADVIGIDISERFLEKARESIPVKWANGIDLPFKDKSFDYVLSIMVFMCIEDLEKAISEVTRVLKPNGKMFFAILHPLADKWDLKTGIAFQDNSNYNRIENRTWVFNLKDSSRFKQEYIHRPIGYYISILSKGFRITRIIEPQIPDEYLKDNKYARLEYLFGEAVKVF